MRCKSSDGVSQLVLIQNWSLTWPEFNNAIWAICHVLAKRLVAAGMRHAFGATSLTSTSPHTIAGSLPPLSAQSVSQKQALQTKHIQDSVTYNSNVKRFSVPLQLSMTRLPVAVEPVKLTLSTPGCSVSRGPRSSPPLSAWTTPAGKNRRASSASLRLQYGVNGLRLVG